MDKKRALLLMQESFDSLHRSGMLENTVTVDADTVLLGSGLTLDSLGFVTFISDMEERISAETNQEHYIILSEVQEFNAENSALSAGTLAEYIEKITG